MLLLYLKYSFLLWVMIGSPSEDLMIMSQLSEDETLLKVAACSQNCLSSKLDKVMFHNIDWVHIVVYIQMYVYVFSITSTTLGI